MIRKSNNRSNRDCETATQFLRPSSSTVICNMARLNQIEIRESEVTYTNQRDWFFHTTGHHIRELLLHFLPRDYVLDGSSKFSAVFGQRPNDKDACYTSLGVTVCHIENFDIERHMIRPVQEQQEGILTKLTNAMMEVARLSGADPNVIRQAADAVRENEFSLELNIKKLARSTKDRKLRVEVFRCLGPLIGEVWEARVCAGDGSIVGVEPITEDPCYLVRTSHFSTSQWCDDVFQVIYSRLGKVQYELDISKYLERSR